MKFKELLAKYQDELSGIYPKEEITTIFFRLSEYFWQITRLIWFLNSHQFKKHPGNLDLEKSFRRN